jgi:hypothetical protein
MSDVSPDKANAMIRAWWTDFAKGNREAVAALLADDVVWEIMFVGSLLPHGGVARGKEDVLKNAFDATAAFYDRDSLRFDITNMVSDGNQIVMEFMVDGYTSAGVRYENVQYVSVIQMEGGKIKNVREYPDALRAKAAHGL